MDEQGVTTFEAILPTFVDQLDNDSNTAAFEQFFQTLFHMYPQLDLLLSSQLWN